MFIELKHFEVFPYFFIDCPRETVVCWISKINVYFFEKERIQDVKRVYELNFKYEVYYICSKFLNVIFDKRVESFIKRILLHKSIVHRLHKII